MAKAFECDMCGEYYSDYGREIKGPPYQRDGGVLRYPRMRFCESDRLFPESRGNAHSGTAADLCPVCLCKQVEFYLDAMRKLVDKEG